VTVEPPYAADVRNAAFDAQLARLDANLEATATLLRDHGETHWATWAMRCRSQLASGDAAGFDWVLGAFGGMGSLNDVWIHAMNGHDIRPNDAVSVNNRLDSLREAIYTDATALRREARRPS
jgi:hypothetical protein